VARTANIRIEPPGPKAREVMMEDSRYVATTTKTSPVVAAHAKGAQVTDVDGNTYLDFATGVSVMNVGYSDPRVVRAVRSRPRGCSTSPVRTFTTRCRPSSLTGSQT